MLHGKLRLPIHLRDTLDITQHALIKPLQPYLRRGAEADWQVQRLILTHQQT